LKNIKRASYFNLLIILLLIGCSTKKNTFINRNINTLGTKYNVLFNGKVAFTKSLEKLENQYQDNFYKRLGIEPFTIINRTALKPASNSKLPATGFDLAEEKAVKAIQKHSMNFNGHEKNSQIDDAYLLLGKARYYTQRFVPALEAFNYTLKNYRGADLIQITKVWKAKTLLRLQNENQAKAELKNLLKSNYLSDKVLANAYTVLAMVYDATDSTELVLQNLKKSVKHAKNPNLKARNLFIVGQIYKKLQQIDSSNLAFNKLIHYKKSPYKYKIHAKIYLAKNAQDSVEVNSQIKNINKLIKDRDNRPYLDQIYYQRGILSIKNKNFNKAIGYFKKSIQKSTGDNYQKSLSYEQLGNYYFNRNKFLIAAAYFDSILEVSTNKNTLRYIQLNRKRNSFNDLIRFEKIAKKDDSILTITNLSKKEQLTYYNNYIKQLKKEAEKKAVAKLKEEKSNFSAKKSEKKNKKEKFYFYNPTLSTYGLKEFKKTWGNITLEDNWNFENKTSKLTIKNPKLKAIIVTDTTLLYNPQFYLEKLPTTQVQIDSIIVQRNNAYYELGILYKEQFKAYKIAASKLEKLLTFKPSKSLILPIKYQLYKIYTTLNSPKQKETKSFILKNYPDSNYASIIKNPKKLNKASFKNETPKQVYKKAYKDYVNKNYISSEKIIVKALEQYKELPIVPKFMLLEAYIHLKLDGLASFSKKLNQLAINYPNTIEGKDAKALKTEITSLLKNKNSFNANSTSNHWYIGLKISKKYNFDEFKNQFSKILQKENINNLTVRRDIYTRNFNIILIKEFTTQVAAKKFKELIKKISKPLSTSNFFIISRSNYGLIQLNKNLKKYISAIGN